MSAEDDIRARLANYLAAETAILTGAQEYVVGQGATARRLTRADLAEVRAAIASLKTELAQAVTVTTRARRVIYLRPR